MSDFSKKIIYQDQSKEYGKTCNLIYGQWADLALEDLIKKDSDWGFDGLELVCWGDHF